MWQSSNQDDATCRSTRDETNKFELDGRSNVRIILDNTCRRSAASKTVSLTLIEEGVYSLVHVDWDTGKEVGKVILGRNPIFNTAGGFFIPLNENDIYITGVFGPVRISKQ